MAHFSRKAVGYITSPQYFWCNPLPCRLPAVRVTSRSEECGRAATCMCHNYTILRYSLLDNHFKYSVSKQLSNCYQHSHCFTVDSILALAFSSNLNKFYKKICKNVLFYIFKYIVCHFFLNNSVSSTLQHFNSSSF